MCLSRRLAHHNDTTDCVIGLQVEVLELLYWLPAFPHDVPIYEMLATCTKLKTLLAPGFWPFRTLAPLCHASHLESLVIHVHPKDCIQQLRKLR